MSGLRSGAIALLLAIPFALYIAWQVQAYTRNDLLGSDAPSDKGLPGKDQLVASKTKTEKWAGDVRKVSSVALQFRAAGTDDATTDDDCTALTRAVAARSADLTDLEKFLSRVAKPQFTGKLVDRYKGWYDETESLRIAANVIEQWFDDRAPVIDSQNSADDVSRRFTALLEPYTKNNSDLHRSTSWSPAGGCGVTARTIDGLSDAVKAPYKRVLDLPLPLPAEDKSADVRTAIGALREMKAQVHRLQKSVSQATTDGITLPDKAQSREERCPGHRE